jgi:hypothetical protein
MALMSISIRIVVSCRLVDDDNADVSTSTSYERSISPLRTITSQLALLFPSECAELIIQLPQPSNAIAETLIQCKRLLTGDDERLLKNFIRFVGSLQLELVTALSNTVQRRYRSAKQLVTGTTIASVDDELGDKPTATNDYLKDHADQGESARRQRRSVPFNFSFVHHRTTSQCFGKVTIRVQYRWHSSESFPMDGANDDRP